AASSRRSADTGRPGSATLGTGADEIAPVRSVHAAGSAFKSATLSSRRDRARSAQLRIANQNAIRWAAQQKRLGEQPRRGRIGRSLVLTGTGKTRPQEGGAEDCPLQDRHSA